MNTLTDAINRIFSFLFMPLVGMRPDYALIIITVVTGVGMLYLYKWTSNQAALKAVQATIKARIIEIQLYKTDLRVMLRALARVFIKNFTYLRLLILPAVFLILLVVVIVVQCFPRFEYRPVRAGEGVLVKAVVKDWDDGESVSIKVPEGMTVETEPLAVPSLREVDWRVRADLAGEYPISFSTGGETRVKTLTVGGGLEGVSPVMARPGFTNYIMNPLESPLPSSSAFEEIVIKYPKRDMGYATLLGMNWIIYFFVVSFLVAVVWKVIFKVH